MIVIVDYGMGNLRSIQKSFSRLEVDSIVSAKCEDIENADKLVLPGVGHFGQGMKNIEELGLRKVLDKMVLQEGTPILGICLGMQLFCNHSEEGDIDGLGWIDADTVRFRVTDTRKYKIPHIGWNSVSLCHSSLLFDGLDEEELVYFVHSYHVYSKDSASILSYTTYEHDFISAVHKDNIYGTQFHPEKSHKVGLQILKNFAERCD